MGASGSAATAARARPHLGTGGFSTASLCGCAWCHTCTSGGGCTPRRPSAAGSLYPVLSPVLPCTEKGRKVGGREEELRSTSLPAAVALSCPRFQHFRGAAWEVLSLSILSGSFQLQFLSKSRWTATHQQLGYLRWPVTVAEEKKERMMFLQNLVPGCSKEFEVLTTPFDGRMIRGKLANFLVEQVINKKGKFYHPS